MAKLRALMDVAAEKMSCEWVSDSDESGSGEFRASSDELIFEACTSRCR